jgi:hypothetical protein
MVRGSEAGLALLEMAGDHAAARSCYLLAAHRTAGLPKRRHLQNRASRRRQKTRGGRLSRAC